MIEKAMKGNLFQQRDGLRSTNRRGNESRRKRLMPATSALRIFFGDGCRRRTEPDGQWAHSQTRVQYHTFSEHNFTEEC
eukprot:12899085-Prorocentrum_lima.AAC.1